MNYYDARVAVLQDGYYSDEYYIREKPLKIVNPDSADLDPTADSGQSSPSSSAVRTITTDQDNQIQPNTNQMATPNDETPPATTGVFISQESAQESHNATTKFADDTMGAIATIPLEARLSRSLYSSSIVPSSQTIVDYLQRPSTVASGIMQASDTTFLYRGDVTEAINALKAERLRGIYMLRCDFEYTLQVNADMFQQGRYILGWVPSGGAHSRALNANKTAYYNSRLANLTTITQLPHVEIDLAKQTHVTLKVPYSSIFPMLEWSTNTTLTTTCLGDVFIIPYSPLDPGSGGASCSWTLWVSLQNVTIGSATANQMGGDETTKEAKALGVGPISSTLDKVSRASALLGPIPIIGQWATTVSWLSGILAGSAAIFGWSKPLNMSAPTRVTRQVGQFSANYDNASTAKPLGLFSQNSVIPHNGVSNTNADEMSFDFIKMQYAYIRTVSFSVADAAQSVLFSIPCNYVYSTNWSKGITYTPSSFIAKQFTKCRGGVRFRIKIVKTPFHRARLLVAFSPGRAWNAFSYANSEYVYREVVDISTTSEFEVCCPYLLPIPWVEPTQYFGTLQVFVENTLVCPTSVTNRVILLVEQAALPDMEFSSPQVWRVEPYMPSTSQMADPYIATPCFELGPNSTIPIGTVAANTVGEVVTSARQLLKVISPLRPVSGNDPTLGATGGLKVWAYTYFPVCQAAGGAGALQRDFFYSDPINLWSSLYTYQTGSVRYTILPRTGATGVVRAFAGSLWTTNTTLLTGGFAGLEDTKSISHIPIEGVLEFQMPVYNSTYSRAIAGQLVNPGPASALSEPYANTTALALATLENDYNVAWLRSAGDDFHCSLFVGVPPVVLRATL
jgi:hypothetical protein